VSGDRPPGAALLGHVALGHLPSVDDAAALVRVTEVVHPDRDAAGYYRRLPPAFASTAEAVEDLNAWRLDQAPKGPLKEDRSERAIRA
jgi:gluconokinase